MRNQRLHDSLIPYQYNEKLLQNQHDARNQFPENSEQKLWGHQIPYQYQQMNSNISGVSQEKISLNEWRRDIPHAEKSMKRKFTNQNSKGMHCQQVSPNYDPYLQETHHCEVRTDGHSLSHTYFDPQRISNYHKQHSQGMMRRPSTSSQYVFSNYQENSLYSWCFDHDSCSCQICGYEKTQIYVSPAKVISSRFFMKKKLLENKRR